MSSQWLILFYIFAFGDFIENIWLKIMENPFEESFIAWGIREMENSGEDFWLRGFEAIGEFLRKKHLWQQQGVWGVQKGFKDFNLLICDFRAEKEIKNNSIYD